MRNKQIEGLRCFAVVFVLIFHFCCRFQQIYLNGEYALSFPVSSFAGFGVSIFLLITGYFSQKTSGGINYCVKRFKKLYPMYIISISIIFIFTHVFNLPQRTVSLREYFLNFIFLGGVPGINYVDGAHWYLRTILLLIVFFAVVQKFNDTIRISSYFIVTVFIVLCKAIYTYIDTNIFTKIIRYMYLFAGLHYFIVAFIGVSISLVMSNRKTQGILLCTLCAISNIWLVNFLQTVAIALFCFLLILCLKNKIPLFENKSIQIIATSSYSIYLIHQHLGFMIMLFFVNRYGYHFWIALLTTFIMLLIGIIVHRYIEQPLNIIIDRITKKHNIPNNVTD